MTTRRCTSGGMDDALRYQQQLQFCKQLHVLHQQLCESTQQSNELLASLYALYTFSSTPSSCLMQLTGEFPEFAAKLQRSFKLHPLRELHVEQMEGDAVEAVTANAEQLSLTLRPMYKELQALGKFLRDASGLLADIHQLLIPITMATAPQLIEFFMALFCNVVRIILLMDKLPWKLLVQVYTIVTTVLDGSSPQGRTAVIEVLEKLQDPVQYLQELFQPISSRVSQILELAVSSVLDHIASSRVLESSTVFDVSRLGQTQLGITGLSVSKTYSFLQRLDDYRSWACLGLLACPAALQGVNAQVLLSALLRDTFLLPVYGNVVLPIHKLFQQHVTPALEQLVASLLQGTAGKAEVQQQTQDARQFVVSCYQKAVEGAEAEHAARRRHINRVLQELLLFLQDESYRSPEALSMALAAQAYARSELLWYFRHVGESLPASPTATSNVGGVNKLVLPLLSSSAPDPCISEDGHVVTLVSAVTSMYDFLVEQQRVLEGCQLATMQALLEQQVLPETAAVLAASSEETSDTGRDMVVPKVLIPLVKSIVRSLADLASAEVSLLGSCQDKSHSYVESSHQELLLQQEQSKVAEREAHRETADDKSCLKAAAAAESTPRLSNGADVAGSSNPADLLSRVQQDVMFLTMLLSSRNLSMRPAVLEAPAQDPQYLESIHQLLDLCPFAKFFVSALEPCCCLNLLVHYQPELMRLQQHVLEGTVLASREQLAGCPALIKVLRWFEYNPPVSAASGDGPRDYAAEAKRLACRMLEEQCGTVALFLSEMAKELHSGLYVVSPAASQGKLTQLNAAAAEASNDTAAALDAVKTAGSVAAGAAAWAGGAASASLRSRAITLAHALDQIGPVQVSSDRLVMPVEYLRAALQLCLLLHTNDMVTKTQVPPAPSQLMRCLSDLLWASAELHQVLAINVLPELWQVLLNHAQPDWVVPHNGRAQAPGAWGSSAGGAQEQAPGEGYPYSRAVVAGSAAAEAWDETQTASAAGCSSSGIPMQLDSMVMAYGEWYMQYVIRDAKGLGVLYAPQLRRFTCITGQKQLIEQRASLPELAALLQMFGPYAATRLAEMSEGLILDCLSQLDSSLMRWRELLDPVTMAVMRDDSCMDAVVTACAKLSDEAQVLTQARQLGRCLAFRQLLGEALAGALNTTLPVIAATISAVASNAAIDAYMHSWNRGLLTTDSASSVTQECGASEVVAARHVCDLFELPRPGLQSVGSPVVADPIVVNTLVGSNDYDRYRAWFNLPTLLGLCLNSPTISTTTLSMADRSMANELHALVHAVKCLTLAQQQAADKVLTCGSKFLHPEAEGQANNMLACFAKVATATILARDDPVVVRTSKHVLLESLCCPQLPSSQLKNAWLPDSRVRSALCQTAL